MSAGSFCLAVPHAAGEPAHGYMSRVASRYGVAPDRLGGRIGVTMGGLMRGIGLDRLADAASIDPDVLTAWSPVVRTRDRRVDLRGESLMLGDWSVSSRRWCPTCLSTDAALGIVSVVQRCWWDVRSVGVCPIHLCLMRDTCAGCGCPTRWNEHVSSVCRCGAVHAEAATSSIPKEDAAMARHVAARLGWEGGRSDELSSEPLDRLPAFAERLGAALEGRFAVRRPRVTATRREHHRSVALALLANPSPAFERALSLISANRHGRPGGLIGAYGWVYSRWLAFPGQDLTGGVLTATMRRHAIAIGAMSAGEATLGGTGASGLTISAVADRIGAGFARARRIVLREGMVGTGLRRGVAAIVADADVATLEFRLQHSMTITAAARLLGVTRRVMRELADAQVVGRCDEGVSSEDVLSLATRLSAGPRPQARAVRLTDLARGGGTTTAELCAAVLEGTVRAALTVPGSTRLADVSVEAGDVRNRRRGGPLSVRGIARRLNVHEDTARHLVSLGVLSDSASGEPSERGLSMFQADFVTPAELALSTGSTPRGMRLLLERLDVEPAFGPPDCRQIFYSRRDAEIMLSGTGAVTQGCLHAASKVN